ncbi:hypothetical protein [Acinetobacter venetianus]|uniref:hypothetical protein n=1 Tax=Acinetobacter venetianus TaxID=52133 RepID=UPI003A940D5E
MSENTVMIQSDNQGFLLGTKRLEAIAKGIDHVDDNTNKILDILRSSIETFASQQLDVVKQLLNNSKISNKKQTKLVEAISKANAEKLPRIRSTRRTIDAEGIRRGSIQTTQSTSQNSPISQARPRKSTVEVEASPKGGSTTTAGRQRDANGRFIGSGTSGRAAETAQTTAMLKTAFSKAMDVVATPKDVSGYDPSVDALNELGTIISPAAKGFRMMGRGANWLYKRRTKRDEILPEAQEKHNKEERKLLKKILDRIGGSRGEGGLPNIPIPGGGLLGGIFKKGGKGLGRILKFGKGIPLLGTALTAMSLMDWDEKSTEQKGGSIGSIAGGVTGAAIGSLLGPVGTVIGGTVGAWAGEKLGGVVAPHVKDWTNSLKQANIPQRMMNSWDTLVGGMSSYFGEKIDNAVETTKEVASTVQDKIESMGDFGASVIDMTLAKAGNKAAQERLKMRDQGLIGHRSNVYQGKYSNSAPTPLQTVKNAGKALVMQPATGKYAPLLDEIARGEATGGAFGTSGYDAIYSGAKIKPPKPISQMTVGEVKAYQKRLIEAGSKSTAVGKYQFIHNKGAFGRMAAEAGLNDSDLFDSKAQDRLAIHYAGGAEQLDKWIKNGDYTTMTNKVARQWASQKNSRGVGYYDGDGLNKARHGGVSVMRNIGQQIQANEAQANKQPAVNPTTPKAPTTAALQAQSIVTASNNNLNKILVNKQPVQTVGTPAPQKVKLPSPKMPRMETVRQPVSTGGQQVKSPMDTVISQNISDRGLAHMVTGGLGMNQYT